MIPGRSARVLRDAREPHTRVPPRPGGPPGSSTRILRGMPGARDRRALVAVLAAVFIASVAVAASAIRPWIAAPLAFDTAASVLHFDRIVAGRHLEQALSTTPKPLLTILYGLVYSATGDWRAISVAALGAWGLCVAGGTLLAWRLGGAIAAVFTGVSLVVSPRLLLETSWALATVPDKTTRSIGWNR